ncbi:MAG: hypothetical protein ABI542_11040 [Gemmatimonadota bacterium]
MRLLPRLLVVGALLGCPNSPTTPGKVTTGPFRLEQSGYWAGSAVVLRGPSPESGNGELRVGNKTISVTRLNDSTLAGQVPGETGGGWQPALLTFRGREFPLDSVLIYGATLQGASAQQAVPGTEVLVTFTNPYDYLRRPTVLTPLEGGVLLTDADFVSYWLLPGLSAFGMGSPGPTPDPLEWIFHRDRDGPFERWRLGAQPELVDTVPSFGWQEFRAYAVLGPNTVLVFPDDTGWVARRDGDGVFRLGAPFVHEGHKRVVLPPRGDRAALIAGGGRVAGSSRPAGIPVFSIPDGEVVYRIPEFQAVGAADFSADGKVLVVAGSKYAGAPKTVLLLRASDGTIMARQTTDYPVDAISFDPFRPYIYAASMISAERQQVEVLARDGLGIVGRMTAYCGSSCRGMATLLVDPILGVAVVRYDSTGPALDLVRFSIPDTGVSTPHP